MLRGEPKTEMPRLHTITVTGVLQAGVPLLFNASLAIIDESETPHPQLAEALPELNTDSWRVYPDGRMDTVYRLRPGLTWHDGKPLTPRDFQFALQVAKDPGFGAVLFKPDAEASMDEIVAVDDRTILIRWNGPFQSAGALLAVFAFPQHIIGEAYERGDRDAFAAHPYFRDEYVGLGPYRMTHWELGAYIEGEAFSNYALGAPKAPRIRVTWAGDPNTAIANVLAGAVDFVESQASVLAFQQGVILKREWEGNVLFDPATIRYIWVQHRRDLVNPAELLDVRVRKAFMHATDRQTLVDALQDGEGGIAHAYISPLVSYYADVDRTVTKYAYDPIRTDQLLTDAGFSKNRDGLYVSPNGAPFSPQLRTVSATTGSLDEREQAMLVDLWRQVGLVAEPSVLPVAQANDGQALSTYQAFNNGSTAITSTWTKFDGRNVAAPENRWTRSNRNGWMSAEYDRLYALFDRTLDRREGSQIRVQMLKLLSDEVPGLPLYNSAGVTGFARGLHGPVLGGSTWNVHTWEWR